MICKHCGAQLPDGVTFCTNCGNAVDASPANQSYTAVTQAQPNTLIFGILSLVLSSGIIGLILGIIGRKKGKAYIEAGGQLTGASKVGYILSLVGMIFGIILTVFYLILIIVAIAGGLSA